MKYDSKLKKNELLTYLRNIHGSQKPLCSAREYTLYDLIYLKSNY